MEADVGSIMHRSLSWGDDQQNISISALRVVTRLFQANIHRSHSNKSHPKHFCGYLVNLSRGRLGMHVFHISSIIKFTNDKCIMYNLPETDE